MAERIVNVVINYKVNTTDVQKAQAASQAAQKATDDLRKTTDQYTKSSSQAAKSTQGFSSELSNLVMAAKAFITAGILKEVVDISLNMAKLSGNIEAVSRAFNRLPGAATILSELRKATHGAVTDLQLMERALRSVNFGLSLKSLPALFEFAAVRAQQTGVSVDYLVNSIVDGIGRKSLRVLDNLQIAQSRIKEEMGGISMEAATVAQVSEAMGRIASQELQKMGGFAETSATKVEQLEVKWEKLRVKISQTLTSPGLLKFYNTMLDNFAAGLDFLLY